MSKMSCQVNDSEQWKSMCMSRRKKSLIEVVSKLEAGEKAAMIKCA